MFLMKQILMILKILQNKSNKILGIRENGG